jgi:hypothetical protein
METAVSIALGIGLSAAAGFRVFVPLFALSIAGYTGYLELSPGFAWMGTLPALISFGTATVLEVLAFYIPWLDNMLDTLATPAAVIAGVLVSASVITDLPPLLKWVLSVIGGGGIAGVIQGATVLTRLKSTTFTAGIGNPVVSTAELGGSVLTSLSAIFLPVITVLLVGLFALLVFVITKRFLFGRRVSTTT